MAIKPKEVYNRASIFTGENYGSWKARMCIHMNSVDKGVWDVTTNGPNKISMTNCEVIVVSKPEAQWNNNDRKLGSHDWKTQNILIFALGNDEYYRVSHCEISQDIWEALDVTNEGNNEVKQSRINTLTQKFQLFHMKHSETIADIKKRFTHLINCLNALCNPISNDIASNKFLR